MQEYIVSLAEAQHAIDDQNRRQLADPCSEFHFNLQLREVWGLGFVRVTRGGRILEMYHDFESSEYRSRFLGNSYRQAMSRCNHVKSFM